MSWYTGYRADCMAVGKRSTWINTCMLMPNQRFGGLTNRLRIPGKKKKKKNKVTRVWDVGSHAKVSHHWLHDHQPTKRYVHLESDVPRAKYKHEAFWHFTELRHRAVQKEQWILVHINDCAAWLSGLCTPDRRALRVLVSRVRRRQRNMFPSHQPRPSFRNFIPCFFHFWSCTSAYGLHNIADGGIGYPAYRIKVMPCGVKDALVLVLFCLRYSYSVSLPVRLDYLKE